MTGPWLIFGDGYGEGGVYATWYDELEMTSPGVARGGGVRDAGDEDAASPRVEFAGAISIMGDEERGRVV